MMKRRRLWSDQNGRNDAFLLLLLLLCCRMRGSDAQNVNLTAISFSSALLTCLGSCQFANDNSHVNLTQIGGTGGNGAGLVGRVMYKNPVRFYDERGVSASFQTSFQFRLSRPNSSSSSSIGDGFAFLIAPEMDIPTHAEGGALGLFNPDNNTAAGSRKDKVVAVEVDTFQNSAWNDPPAPHLGLDVGNLSSWNTSTQLTEIAVGRTVGVWIRYSAQHRELEVRIASSGNGSSFHLPPYRRVLLCSGFDLAAAVQQDSFVGFSAATGFSVEINQILSWDFATTGFPDPDPEPVSELVPGQAPAPGPGPDALSRSSHGGARIGLVVAALSLLAAAGLAVAIACCCCLSWRLQKSKPRASADSGWEEQAVLGSGSGLSIRSSFRTPSLLRLPDAGFGPRHVPYTELCDATQGFKSQSLLGEGGFGGVYVGTMKDGTRVAVKKVRHNSSEREKEFLAEVTIIGQLSHKNLVQLKGWCHEHGDLLLVYEYMPNGSLDNHLYPIAKAPRDLLTWAQRLSIVRGLADALFYLHRGCKQPVIHRDVKPSNIMLDADFAARLGDFGLAIAVEKDKVVQTVSRAAGTIGYFAPEAQETGKVGTESDVFSFGVVALEVVCGKKPLDWSRPRNQRHLDSWVWSLYADSRLLEAVDPRLAGDYDEEEVVKLLQLGLMCSLPDPTSRPTMSLVTLFLTGAIDMPHLPKSIPSLYAPVTSSTDILSFAAVMRSLNNTTYSVKSSAPTASS